MLQDMDKPSKVEVGQRWQFEDDDTYVVTRFDEEHQDWVTVWNGDGDEFHFPSDMILDDTFLGYGEVTAPQPSGNRAADWLRNVAKVLEEKAISYGDSVGNPIRVFSHAGKTEGIKVRIDDKLSRVARGKEWPGDDVIVDLVGYLALLAVTEEEK